MNNPFQSPAFSMTALTAAINILPNQFGKLDQLNLMPARPVRFRQIAVEERNGVLNLLPTLPVGAPGTVGKRGRRTLRSFIIRRNWPTIARLSSSETGFTGLGMEPTEVILRAVMLAVIRPQSIGSAQAWAEHRRPFPPSTDQTFGQLWDWHMSFRLISMSFSMLSILFMQHLFLWPRQRFGYGIGQTGSSGSILASQSGRPSPQPQNGSPTRFPQSPRLRLANGLGSAR